MLVIGHRGAAGDNLENTLASFKKAIDLGVDYIETDVQKTKDGRLVLFHDRTLMRMTGRAGYIKVRTYNELCHDFPLKGPGNSTETIPLLEDLCRLAAETDAKLYVEAKAVGIESEIVEMLDKYLESSMYLLASFHHKAVVEFRRLKPGAKTIALLEASPISIEKIISDTKCDYVGFGVESLDYDLVDEVHRLGCGVIVYTVDSPDEIELVKSLGVDGIVSNFPDRVIKAVR